MPDYPKAHDHECPTCRGTGEIVDKDAAGLHYTDCSVCKGRGTLPYRASPSVKREADPPHTHDDPDAAAAEAGSAG